jgi:hypothetical protein
MSEWKQMSWLDGENCQEEGHTCPYAEEINGDYTTLCNCTPEQTRECMMDI